MIRACIETLETTVLSRVLACQTDGRQVAITCLILAGEWAGHTFALDTCLEIADMRLPPGGEITWLGETLNSANISALRWLVVEFGDYGGSTVVTPFFDISKNADCPPKSLGGQS